MPTRLLRSAGLAIASIAVLCALPALAGASKPADLRVIDPAGTTLAEHTQYTGKVRIKTRPGADCFGAGTGGSGDRVTVPRATALGIAEDASAWDRDIKPLQVTDSFDFGLGLCGFGKTISPETGFWYLKVNHVGAQVGGDQAKLKKGDEVLWYLIEDFNQPMPNELMVEVPARVNADIPVRVWEYADDGSREPAVGATVTNGAEPTDETGRTRIKVAATPTQGTLTQTVRATREGAIPSNEAEVCVAAKLQRCANQPPSTIRGSAKGEVIRGTRGDDEIAAGKGKDVVRGGRGDDRIDVKGGGKDVVRCGGGDDRVKADKRDKLKGCK